MVLTRKETTFLFKNSQQLSFAQPLCDVESLPLALASFSSIDSQNSCLGVWVQVSSLRPPLILNEKYKNRRAQPKDPIQIQ